MDQTRRQQLISDYTKYGLVDRIAELEAQLAEAREAIKAFAYSQRWCHDSWKNQDAIKPLFDIAKALAGEE